MQSIISQFSLAVFQALLVIEGVLFSLLGYLYTIYCVFAAEKEQRKTILENLTEACRYIINFLIYNLLFIISTLIIMYCSFLKLLSKLVGNYIILIFMIVLIIGIGVITCQSKKWINRHMNPLPNRQNRKFKEQELKTEQTM